MALRRTAHRGPFLPRFRRDDRAAGTMVSYVVGAAVFIMGSSVLVGFIVEPPGNPGSGLEQQDLKTTASAALEVLMGTAGYPPNWHTKAEEVDRVSRLGLVQQGSTVRLDPQKFSALARGGFYYPSTTNGFVDYIEARKALGLEQGYDFHLRAVPLLDRDDVYYGTKGLGHYRVAYVGDWSGVPPLASAAAAWEQAALNDLDVGFTNLSRTAVLGMGDVFQDDATILKSVLVPLLGTRVAQVAINEGSGLKHDFHRVNSTDVDHLVSPSLLSESKKSLALSRLDNQGAWSLGYTKGREIRATIGTINTTDQSSVILAWKEHVDTKGAGTTRDGGDYGYLEVSPDGGASWYPLTNSPGARSQDSPSDPQPAGLWRDRSATLSAFNCVPCMDNDDVLVAVHWVADADNDVGYGWILDDFRATTAGVPPQVLATKDFESPEYDLLVIGSNVDQNALTPSEVKNAIRDYVEIYGGRILVLGGETNTQWLQPLFHVAVVRDASPGLSSPDPTHPLLTVPNELGWQGYDNRGRAWDFNGGADDSLFNMVIGAGPRKHVLTASASGAFGSEGGGAILTTWRPYEMERTQRLPFLANAITYGHFHQLYMDVGPEIPSNVPIGSVSRTAVMQKTTEAQVAEYVEISFVLYVWRGDASASIVSASLPSAPTGFVAARQDGSVYLSWSPPEREGDSQVSAYVVYRGTTPSGLSLHQPNVPASQRYYLDAGLTNGVTYYYKVAARNAHGEGLATPVLSATPSARASAPESPSATGGAGNIVLTWTPPMTNGGTAITAYRIYRSTTVGVDPMNGQMIAETGATTSYTDAGLPYPFTAWYRIVAVNAVGEGAPSSDVTASTLSLPHAPAQPAAVPGRDSITITWTPPISPKPIIGYNVFVGDTAENTAYLLSVQTPNFTEENLGMGATRYYRVRAWSEDGVGGLSPAAGATTFRLPTEPTGVQATGGPDKVTLTWGPPQDVGGGTVQYYRIYHRDPGGSYAHLANTVLGQNVSFDHAGLADNSAHFYRISAVTEAGEGPQSPEVSGTTWDVPSAPLLTAVPGPGSKTVTLTWVAPQDAGDPNAVITEYRIYRGTSSGGETYYATTTNSLGFTDANEENVALTTYYYYVRAVTAAGLGTVSNEVFVAMPP